jgi:hypothetical protein
MTRSAKLGVASTLLLGSAFVPLYPNWRGPISLAFIWVSAVLGLLPHTKETNGGLLYPA